MDDEKRLKEIQETLFKKDLLDKIHFEYPETIDKLAKAISEKVQSLTNSTPKNLARLIENKEITIELNLEDCLTLLTNMEKLLDYERERIGLKKGLHFFIDRDQKALKAYFKSGRRQEKRLRDVARILGLTNGTGKKQSRIKKSALLREYMELIFVTVDPETLKRKKPIEKWEAIRVIKEKYEIQSDEAVLKHLKNEIAKLKKYARNSGYVGGFDGLLPPNWPKV